MKIKYVFFPFLLYSGFSHATLAELKPANYRPFLSVETGYQWGNDETYPGSMPHAGMYGFSGGIQLNPSWSWDLGYQYHEDLYASQTQITVANRLIQTGISYDWIPSYRLPNTHIYGRLGVGYWTLDKDQPSHERIHETGFSPLAEAGLSYHFTDNIAMKLGYQFTYGLGNEVSGEYNSHMIKAGFTYYFGDKWDKILPLSPYIIEDAISGFASDSTEITPEIKQTLSQLAKEAQAEAKGRDYLLSIMGHTDATGSKDYNQWLSKKRAQAALEVIDAFGLPISDTQIDGQGEEHPVASNETAEGRAQNRRIEVYMRTLP